MDENKGEHEIPGCFLLFRRAITAKVITSLSFLSEGRKVSGDSSWCMIMKDFETAHGSCFDMDKIVRRRLRRIPHINKITRM